MPLTYNIPDSVLTTTLQNSRQNLEDNVFTALPLLYMIIGRHSMGTGTQFQGSGDDSAQSKNRKEVVDGGYNIVQPLMYGTNSTARSYSGYDTLDTTPQEGITAAAYNWKQISASISISGREDRQNNGKNAVIKLMDGKMTQAQMSLMSEFARQLAGTGTDSTADLLGLQTIVSTTGTVGGIARSGNSWWQASVTTSVGSFATNGLDKMRTKYNTVSKGNDHPDILISDQSTFEYYEKVLQPLERFNDTATADAGFENLKFKGATYVFDNNSYFPSGTMYFLNSKYLHLTVQKDADFSTTDFIRPANQDARVAQILFMGEFNVSNCARQGSLTGITA